MFEKAIEEKLKEMLEKLKISINRIHIRFEDDSISYQNPVSIGLLIENVMLLPQKKEILSMIQTQFVSVNAEQLQQNREQIKQLKYVQITNLSVYMKNQSEQAIPDTLLKEVAYQNMGILEAITFDDLRNFLIASFFSNKNDLHINKILQIDLLKCNYLHTISPKNNNNTLQQMNSDQSSQSQIQFINSALANMQNNYFLQMSLTQPQIMINTECFNTWKDIIQFFKNQTYWKYLHKFKPKLRPFIKEYNQNMTNEQKKVNSLIIRDWFNVLIWKHRLERIEQQRYPELYKKYQLSSLLYSLEYPSLSSIKIRMTNFGELLRFFNENLIKEQNDEIEMLQTMKESEKRSMQLIEELKESTFILIFKMKKFEIYFTDKNNRFLTLYFNLMYFELSNKFDQNLFFFDISPLSAYLYGGDRFAKGNIEQDKQTNASLEQNFQELPPFQPRSIYDQRNILDKNNESLLSQGQGQGGFTAQNNKATRKIFGNNNAIFQNQGSKQFVFNSQDGLPSAVGSNQVLQLQQQTRRSNDLISNQSDRIIKGNDYSDIEHNSSKGDHILSNFQSNYQFDMQLSSPQQQQQQQKKRKQIFEHQFDIQSEFFEEKSQCENEKKKVDFNLLMRKAKERRFLFETKTNFIIKYKTNQGNSQINLNVEIPQIKIYQDTRDIKDILTYFKDYQLKEFLQIILKCISKPETKIESIVSNATKLKKNVNNTSQSSLRFSTINRPLAAPQKDQKQSGTHQMNQKGSIQEQEFNVIDKQKDGLFYFDDEDDDINEQAVDEINKNIKKNNNQGIYTNPDPDLIDFEDLKDCYDSNFPKEYQSLLFDKNNNIQNKKLEAILEDPLETVGQTTYKTLSKATNILYEDIDQQSKIRNRMKKEGRMSVQKQKISMNNICNYYLYHKIAGMKRRKEQQKKIHVIDILDEYIGQKQVNICFNVGSISLDAKDHFSPDENETILTIQIPPGQIIINFNSNQHNRHLLDIYHFKITTTSKFKIIKYMINRIQKMIDVSSIFSKDDDDFDLDL